MFAVGVSVLPYVRPSASAGASSETPSLISHARADAESGPDGDTTALSPKAVDDWTRRSGACERGLGDDVWEWNRGSAIASPKMRRGWACGYICVKWSLGRRAARTRSLNAPLLVERPRVVWSKCLTTGMPCARRVVETGWPCRTLDRLRTAAKSVADAESRSAAHADLAPKGGFEMEKWRQGSRVRRSRVGLGRRPVSLH
ncbi:hypothetical protein BKA80DRAFT_117924 [Phyllosticta citrichinensis]